MPTKTYTNNPPSVNVKKIPVGNKGDMGESQRAVSKSRGHALADEYGINFLETSAKTKMNVEEVFFALARVIRPELNVQQCLPLKFLVFSTFKFLVY